MTTLKEPSPSARMSRVFYSFRNYLNTKLLVTTTHRKTGVLASNRWNGIGVNMFCGFGAAAFACVRRREPARRCGGAAPLKVAVPIGIPDH